MPRHEVKLYPHRFMLGLSQQLYQAVEINAQLDGISQAEYIRRAITAYNEITGALHE